MNNLEWCIQGYLVLLGPKIVGQFDSPEHSRLFRDAMSETNPGTPVTVLWAGGSSTVVTNTDEKVEAAFQA